MAHHKQHSSELLNFEQSSSNSKNYVSFQTSSSPNSFPNLMNNGILVKYEQVKFTSEIVEDTNSEEVE